MLRRYLILFLSTIVLALPSVAVAQDNASENLFPIFVNGRVGYIDSNGNVIIQPQFEIPNTASEVEMELISEFYDGLAGAQLNGKWGFIDRSGKWIIQPQFLYVSRFSDDRAGVEIDGKWGFIDTTGRIVIQPQFHYYTRFSEGLSPVMVTVAHDDDGDEIEYVFIDPSGRVAIESKPKATYYEFSEGLAAVITKDGKMGYIDKTGEFVIKPRESIAQAFSEGLALVSVDSKSGFIDEVGKWIVRPQFDLAAPFSDGMALITNKIGDEYLDGYIDQTGKVVFKPQFKSAGYFSDGVASVPVGNKRGYMDKTGKFVIPPKFDETHPFYKGLALVRVGQEVGYIKKSGEYVWQTTRWDVQFINPEPMPDDSQPRNIQTKYFPDLVFSSLRESDDFTVQWYSQHLEAMREPSLFQASKMGDKLHSYRFLWLRTFSHPIAIRLSIESDGTGTLIYVLTSGGGGYEPGEIRTNRSVSLTRKQVSEFLDCLKKADFWKLPTEEEVPEGVVQLDGAQWIIEGVKDGKYHIVDRWSPEKGAYRAAALFLLQLTQLKVKEVY